MSDIIFGLKNIPFLGREHTIICQNENGPCPLLAISNVLILQRNIKIDSDNGIISLRELLQIVANYILENASRQSVDSSCGSEKIANPNQVILIESVMNILPKLANGLDLNVFFTSSNKFEFTEEISVFDALLIPLLHGWLVDPVEDSITYETIKNLSYNHLLYKLVEYRNFCEKAESIPVFNTAESVPVLPESNPASNTTAEPLHDHVEGSRANENKLDEVEKSFIMVNKDQAISPASRTEDEGFESRMLTFESESSLAIPSDPYDTSPKRAGNPLPDNNTLSDESSQLLMEGEIIENFLERTASQLTDRGVKELYQVMNDRQLAVFFRNNHFSTMFCYNGLIFVLVTDLGYQHEPGVVWELLDGVTGNTEYYNGDFIPLSVIYREQEQLLGTIQSNGGPSSQLNPSNQLDPWSNDINYPVIDASPGASSYSQPKTAVENYMLFSELEKKSDSMNHINDPDLLLALELQRSEQEAFEKKYQVDQPFVKILPTSTTSAIPSRTVDKKYSPSKNSADPSYGFTIASSSSTRSGTSQSNSLAVDPASKTTNQVMYESDAETAFQLQREELDQSNRATHAYHQDRRNNKTAAKSKSGAKASETDNQRNCNIT